MDVHMLEQGSVAWDVHCGSVALKCARAWPLSHRRTITHGYPTHCARANPFITVYAQYRFTDSFVTVPVHRPFHRLFHRPFHSALSQTLSSP
eukprot:165334-Chlamydomonas_euryale.AAC.2